MAVVTLRIDGQEVAVPAGSSLLAASRVAGLALPVLCHLDGLTPVGACRLCLVAIEGQGKLQPACTSEALEGQVVATNTAELQELRRMAVELFFAEGNHVCAYCVASGACELQAMAVTVGMDHSRFPYQYPLRAVDASHPLFSHDANRCILCSRCVRACAEVQGTFAITIDGRGFESKVVASQDQPFLQSECVSCGACVQACPSHALVEKSLFEGEYKNA